MKTKEYYGHECQAQPELVDQVYTYIRERPGIDAPDICKDIVINQFDEPVTEWGGTDVRNLKSLSGVELANYLGEWWGGTWNEVCESIDYMLEEGCITFSDDGELHVAG